MILLLYKDLWATNTVGYMTTDRGATWLSLDHLDLAPDHLALWAPRGIARWDRGSVEQRRRGDCHYMGFVYLYGLLYI